MSEKVSIEVNGSTIEVARGKSLLAGLLGAGVRHLHVCGGQGLCSTCRVKVLAGGENLTPPSTLEKVSLRGHLSFLRTTRLACQTRVLGPVSVKSILPRWGTLPATARPEAGADGGAEPE